MEHGLYQHSAGCRACNRAAQRPREAAYPLGTWHDSGNAYGQSAVCPRTQTSAASLLLQCHDAFALCDAAADISHSSADLSRPRSRERAGILGGHPSLRAAAPFSLEPHELSDPGTASPLLLE